MDKDPAMRLTVKEPLADKTKFSAAGLTGVWAEEKTRESIFSAFKRKETFATSGTFIRARLFAGWDYAANLTQSADWVKKAYAEGVSMGSELPPKPAGAARRHSSWRPPRIRVPAIWIASRSSRLARCQGSAAGEDL
jgi:hypothetical protein